MATNSEELFEASLCINSEEWTKDTLSGLPACKGVLLFVNRDGQPIQLLQAASIRRTAQAKLIDTEEESNVPSRKTDISELTERIDYTCCYNNFQSQMTYLRLAHAVFPDNASDWIQLPRPSFSVIDMSLPLPYFFVSTSPETNIHRKVFGLFPNRKSAGLFCDTLNTVFGLCRNPSLLGSGNEPSCPYLQMQSCPGPCVGQLKTETYCQFVTDAITTAGGEIDTVLAERKQQMQSAAQSMYYERAKLLKDQVDAIEKLKSPAFHWTSRLDELAVLHIDRADKIKVEGQRKLVQQYAIWKITADGVFSLGQCSLDDFDVFHNFLLGNQGANMPSHYTQSPYEHLGTLSLFLFRNNVQGLWLNISNGLPDASNLNNQLINIFKLETEQPPE